MIKTIHLSSCLALPALLFLPCSSSTLAVVIGVKMPNNHCTHVACSMAATHGDPEIHVGPQFCANHSAATHVRYSDLRCQHDGCQVRARYALPPRAPQYCAKHSPVAYIDMRGKRCDHPQCMDKAIYAVFGMQQAQHCAEHRQRNQCYLWSARCKSCTSMPYHDRVKDLYGLTECSACYLTHMPSEAKYFAEALVAKKKLVNEVLAEYAAQNKLMLTYNKYVPSRSPSVPDFIMCGGAVDIVVQLMHFGQDREGWTPQESPAYWKQHTTAGINKYVVQLNVDQPRVNCIVDEHGQHYMANVSEWDRLMARLITRVHRLLTEQGWIQAVYFGPSVFMVDDM